tara:strand:- start:105 stop:320 length:216 start_codon:yes stop_codon:yes gene_type:complete
MSDRFAVTDGALHKPERNAYERTTDHRCHHASERSEEHCHEEDRRSGVDKDIEVQNFFDVKFQQQEYHRTR